MPVPTPGASTTTSMPAARSAAAGPMPERSRSCAEPTAPALSTTVAARTDPGGGLHADRASPLDQHPAHEHAAAHGEPGQPPPRRQVGHGGVHPDAVATR